MVAKLSALMDSLMASNLLVRQAHDPTVGTHGEFVSVSRSYTQHLNICGLGIVLGVERIQHQIIYPMAHQECMFESVR